VTGFIQTQTSDGIRGQQVENVCLVEQVSHSVS
jgi:hypothetical protein